MATFAYTARNRQGKIQSGTLEASSQDQAREKLQRRKLAVVRLAQHKTSQGGFSPEEAITPIFGSLVYRDYKGAIQISLERQQPSSKDVIVFTKQFATMINSGVPLIQALHILSSQQTTRGFRQALHAVEKSVENGATISQALGKHPSIFDSLYTAMTAAGEASGKLDTILLNLVSFLERSEKIKNQVKSAMTYPFIITGVAIAVVSGLLAFVVPTFASQYAESGRELPGLTQFVIDSSNHFIDYMGVYFASLMVAGFLLYRALKTPQGRELSDTYVLRAPVLGGLLQKAAIGRFCSTLAIMLQSGVNLLTALSICAASSGNTSIERFIVGVRTSLEKGSNLSTPLAQGPLFPQMVISMIAVGEATGNLDEMLRKVSDFYDEEVDLAVRGLLSLIEPILIVTIGLLVGFIVIAMYLPVFEMAG